jgi:hypothetical protein
MVYLATLGITPKLEILFYSKTVKGKFAVRKCPYLLARIDDLHLNYCILKEKAKNTT